MKSNETYAALATIRTVNGEDEAVELKAGQLYKAVGVDAVVSVADGTGEVIRLPGHMWRNPSWYFHRVGELRQPPPAVTHEDYVRELVKGTPGLLGSCYWDVCQMERCAPCERPIASNASFTATLSKLGFEMRRDGEVVKGVKHGARDCTYHVPPPKRANLDGRFAA